MPPGEQGLYPQQKQKITEEGEATAFCLVLNTCNTTIFTSQGPSVVL